MFPRYWEAVKKCPSLTAPRIEDQSELLCAESDIDVIRDVLIEVCDILDSISVAGHTRVSGFEVLPYRFPNATMKTRVVFSLLESVSGFFLAPDTRSWGHMCGRVTRKRSRAEKTSLRSECHGGGCMDGMVAAPNPAVNPVISSSFST